MQNVTGIGGLFSRSKNPAAWGEWYKVHLGIDLAPAGYSDKPRSQAARPTVFAPLLNDTDSFGSPDKQWTINLRVRILMDCSISFATRTLTFLSIRGLTPNGRFARLHDPESNPIELWEPK